MPKQHIQPDGLFESARFGYTQVVTSPPGTQVFISGQTAIGQDFQIAGGSDLGEQARHALANLGHALRAAGATTADVTSLRIYVVDYKPEDASVVGPPLLEFLDQSPPPAQTLIGVQALGLPGLRIEIEATAVISN